MVIWEGGKTVPHGDTTASRVIALESSGLIGNIWGPFSVVLVGPESWKEGGTAGGADAPADADVAATMLDPAGITAISARLCILSLLNLTATQNGADAVKAAVLAAGGDADCLHHPARHFDTAVLQSSSTSTADAGSCPEGDSTAHG